MIKTVLDVKIDDISKGEALKRVSRWLEKEEFLKRRVLKKKSSLLKIIVTPGPEFLLTAQKDEEFKEILNKADLSLPDGFGLQLLAGVKNRVPGTDFMLALCELAAENGWSIGLLGGRSGVARKAAENLRRQFPKVKVVYTADGAEADRVLNDSDTMYNSKQLIDVLFVAFGHPRQEKFLWKMKNEKFRIKIGMGVGGAFDYISGLVPRAPKFVRTLGLEWLWRLFLQPHRIRRIFNAVVVFPIMLLVFSFKAKN